MISSKRLVASALTVSLTLALLALAGCGSGEDESAEVALEGTYWVADGYAVDGEMTDVLEGTHLDIVFEGVNVSGSSGCNRYNGPYTIDGNAISIGPLASTLMACEEELMAQETAFQAAITSAAEWGIEGETLTLLDADGNEVAVFEADMTPLVGQPWLCTGYNNGQGGVVSVALDTTITIEFSDNDKAGGSSGCNTYQADYEIDDEGGMTLSQIAVTEAFCAEPEGIMEQEETYLEALTGVASYEIQGSNLTLRWEDGAAAATFMRE